MAAESVTLQVGQDGRILIPARLREAMGIARGGAVHVSVEDGEMVISSPAARIRKVQALVRQFDTGEGSAVDEFIAERRAAAARGE